MIQLYHCKGARSVRPLWTLYEMGLEHELITLPFPPRVFQKEYLGINSLGTIPYLIDGDVRMTESAAICQYLVEKYGPTPLAVTPDEPDYASYLNWLHHSDATLAFAVAVVFRYSHVEPEERRQPQVVEDYTQFYRGRLRMLAATLEDGRQYLCSGRFTIADICIGYALQFGKTLGLDYALTPEIEAYFQRITDRPAYKKVDAE